MSVSRAISNGAGSTSSARLQPVNPAEARNQVRALDGQAVEVEVLEVGVHRGDRMAGEIAAPVARLVGPREPSLHRHTLTGERVLALAGAVEQQRRPRVVGEIARMVRKVREQEQGSAVVVGRDVRERYIRSALGHVQQGTERSSRHRTDHNARDGRRIGFGLSTHCSRSVVASAGILTCRP
jgi:hypothetical protein